MFYFSVCFILESETIGLITYMNNFFGIPQNNLQKLVSEIFKVKLGFSTCNYEKRFSNN